MRGFALAFLCLVLAGTASAQRAPDAAVWRPLDPENTLYIDTAHGRIVVEMYPEVAPRAVERIKTLARMQFYDGLTFHRVIEGFMAQGGDPLGDGTGASPLPDLPAEFTFRRGPEFPFVQAAQQTNFRLGFYKAMPIATQPDALMSATADGRVYAHGLHCPGVASMARGEDDNTANSQFFLMRDAYPRLDGEYTIWGRVVFGLDVVRRLNVGEPPPNPDRMLQVRVAADLPETERAPIYVMRTDSREFRDLIQDVRRERRADFSVCDIEVPARVPRTQERERRWWSIIPFLN